MRKTQYFQVEFKSVEVKEDGGKLTIEGFASTPDLDSYDDIVRPSAFVNTMPLYMQKPLILLQHNMEKIPGKAIDYRIEERGLYIKADIFNNIDGVMKNIREGLLGAFSIGFQALKWEIREIDGRWIREITELRLVEVSIVAFPANVNARFSIAKSVKSFFDSLAEIKSLGAGLYECKSNGEEIVNFEEEMKDEEIVEVEIKEQIEEKEEEKTEEETPADTPQEEEKQDETQNDGDEKAGESPADVPAIDEKAEEMKALQEEIELLKKSDETLRAELKSKDDEIETLKKSLSDTEKKLEEKETEIKEFLSVGVEEKREIKSSARNYGNLDYFKDILKL